MKKVLIVLLIVVLVVAGIFIINKKSNPLNKPYSELTVEDLLSTIKDINHVTPEEYITLISTYSNVKINDDMTLEENITDEAIDRIDIGARPELDTYLQKLLESNSPQVRGYGISLITSLFGVSDKNIELAKNLIRNEKNEYVLYKAIKALSNEAKTAPDIAEFLKRMATHKNTKIREAAATALGNSWSEGVDGALETVISLMNDSDKDVRKAACSSSGKLHDEAVIEPLVKILNNPDDFDIHGSCVEGLNHLWYDFPFFEQTSERAYNATMDYLKTTPRSEKIPAWSAVGSFKTTSTQDSFKKWKEKATYFNIDEIYNIMVNIIKDPDASYLARTSAIDVIKSHCSEGKFTELKTVVYGLTDSDASNIKSKYDSLDI